MKVTISTPNRNPGENPPPLQKGTKANFGTIKEAAKNKDLCLVSARRTTGEPVALLCAMNFDGEFFSPVPLAEMIEGNPYEMYQDPTADKHEENEG